MIHPLLKNIDKLDFSNPQQVREFGSLYLNYANLLGWGIGENIPAADRSAMVSIGKKLVKNLDAAFKESSPAYCLSAYDTYDWAYRISYDTPPFADFTSGIVSRALDACILGDKEIDIYELYRLIDLGLMFNPELYKGKPLRWKTLMLSSWYDEFQTGKCSDSREYKDLSDKDLLNRVSILLNADLCAVQPDSKTFKASLFNSNIHYVDNLMTGVNNYDVDTLMALYNFVNASWPAYITEEEKDAYSDAVWSAVYSKTDSPYLQASIATMKQAEKRAAETIKA